jgi:RNA methyltransferase, TrmH family
LVEELTSVKNTRVKEWKKLQTHKGRKKTGHYLLEGWHLVNEALMAGRGVHELIGTKEELEAHPDIVARFEQVYSVTPAILAAVTETVTPQGIMAVADLPDLHRIPSTMKGAWLFLDRVQDPGNVGTMVRTADAAGFSGVVAGDGSADFFSPKVIRSMQGSQFHLDLYEGDLAKWFEDAKQAGLPVYGTQLNPEAKDFRTVQPKTGFVLVMGNEGRGMSSDLLSQTMANLYIPMRGQAESLNVAVSAGILMFELAKNLSN